MTSGIIVIYKKVKCIGNRRAELQRLKEYIQKNKIDFITGAVAIIILIVASCLMINDIGMGCKKEKLTFETNEESISDNIGEDVEENIINESLHEITTGEVTDSNDGLYSYKSVYKKLYATDGLNVRNMPSEEGNVVGILLEGQRVVVTGQCNETGWYRIDYKGDVGYVCNEYFIEENFIEAPTIVAEAAILYDVDNEEVLYEKNADEKMYPASLTKIMTTLIACEQGNLDDVLTFSSNCKNIPGDSSVYGVKVGESVTVRDSLHMLMLVSGNDVGVGIAEHISGTELEFAKLMTQRAKEAGANNTNFVNAHGYHNENHYTTARDMMLITVQGLKNEDFVDVWEAKEYTVPQTNKSYGARKITNIHRMLNRDYDQYYPYALGGKTGFTDDAGRCSITTAKKDGRTFLCIIMKSNKANQFKDAETLFEFGFLYK